MSNNQIPHKTVFGQNAKSFLTFFFFFFCPATLKQDREGKIRGIKMDSDLQVNSWVLSSNVNESNFNIFIFIHLIKQGVQVDSFNLFILINK